jgi:hypothetical protein
MGVEYKKRENAPLSNHFETGSISRFVDRFAIKVAALLKNLNLE